MSTSSVQSIIKDPIANRVKPEKPIANSLLVDQLFGEYSELIDKRYKLWFLKRFNHMNPELIRRAASEAKADGKNPQRLFTFLIKKYCQQWYTPLMTPTKTPKELLNVTYQVPELPPVKQIIIDNQ